MIKWEYLTEEVPDAELVSGILENRLNKMGKEGWELVTFSMDVSLGANSFAIFKRMEKRLPVVEKVPKVPVPETAKEPLPKSETTAASKPPEIKAKKAGSKVTVKKVLLTEAEVKKGGVKPRPSAPKPNVKPTLQKLSKGKRDEGSKK